KGFGLRLLFAWRPCRLFAPERSGNLEVRWEALSIERGQSLAQGRCIRLGRLQTRADLLLGVLIFFVLPEIVVQVALRALGRVQRQDDVGQCRVEVIGDLDGRGAFLDLPEVGLKKF